MQALRRVWQTPAVSQSLTARRHFGAAASLKTPLYELHLDMGGKMVDFAGWSLPVTYKDMGHIDSHLHTRTKASVFDVSHMGQVRLTGKDRVAFIEKLSVGDMKSLQPQDARLTVLTNEKGGIIDDCIVTAQENFLHVVINAGCRDKDIAHMKKHLAEAKSQGMDVDLDVRDDLALLALQGPSAMKSLQKLLPASIDLTKVPFMTGILTPVSGIEGCTVTRCGYTGEDGFEISVPNDSVVSFMKTLLDIEGVKAAGLAARDSLRLEAGLCLYGHDMDEDTTPVEAGLTWTIGKRRRTEGGFLGFDAISEQLKNGVERKRVGMLVTGRPAREGAEVVTEGGEKVGRVCSGTFSPSLGRPVAMAYVKKDFSKAGTKLKCVVGGKGIDAEVSKMPFVPAQYYKVP
uniref:Aminomethyltransferase n=1 Tax=Chromera velia CCMP2878 TaxID=1169474 RepID=A0A0G4IBE5_9ALVE|mmetsp:Transcript_16498/g.33596  ORF Transcript_16498/g.33596 Transcript_16498/m.33596 type:complete len:402 (-) Transcript_16498:799-2004(-)|eukprot:Cvel_12729.t1-p1 / transcript=Cvel_12729.t1 / gene=Cvel_12729 / organism=Chromera_velia_CCMP2878 / gene_product=Aminomethyltransferase, mitochondrial, putative / transcript_product=Aminomethyltransferase, mitochondrial, putative / location=Cvel_scaffold845:38239-39441(+) / protein_length=401 / sequence_SO=supercontig / SO=protein_coding / is_pseudo=false